MSEFLTKAQESFLIYRLIIAKVVLTVIVTFCIAWQTAMAQNKWSQLDADERFFTGCCIVALVGDKLIAFFDKSMSKISKGELPIDNGNTVTITKDK